MPREGDKHDRWRAKKKWESTKLKEDKKLCETEWCFQIIWSFEQYCDSCQLSRYPERAKRCLVCYEKTLYSYCDKHNKTCLNCDSRNLAANSKYCAQHAWSCSTCSTRTPSGQIYCETHQKEENLKRLIWEKFSLSNPQEVVRFNTWWNKNLATVINGNNSYTLWVLVYEPAKRNRTESLQKFEINQGYDKSSLASTQNKASSIRSELNGENPILVILCSYGTISPSIILSEPYVIKREIPCRMETYKDKRLVPYPADEYFYRDQWWEYYEEQKRIYPDNPDECLKPLDIVKVKNKKGTTYFHFAVYLGNGKVSHITQDNQGVKIESWSEFLDGAVGELVRYHFIIPFRKWEDTVRHIAKAAANHYKRGDYNLCNDNCEHYAWEQITGIDYSEQAIERPDGASIADFIYLRGIRNVSYWTSVNLQNMIKNSSQKFDNLKSSDNYEVRNKINEIKGSESEWQARIEVPYRSDCQIM